MRCDVPSGLDSPRSVIKDVVDLNHWWFWLFWLFFSPSTSLFWGGLMSVGARYMST